LANHQPTFRGFALKPKSPAIFFLSSLRNRMQLAIFILTMAIGLQFFLFVEQAGNGGPITITRPAGVEGFLPIGALLGWKRFLTTGVWDSVHPAAMVILLYAAAISFLFRKSFCSWFCPVGTLSEWLWKLGYRFFGKNIRLPALLDWPLRALKYLLFGFFVYITVKMAPSEITSFLNSPYYKLADVKMLHFFTRIGPVALATVAKLMVLSFFVKNFWCRYLCPYGALMGIFAVFSPTAIKRNIDTCVNCRRCSQACSFDLPVHKKTSLFGPACSGCMDCLNVCPQAGTLSLKSPGQNEAGWNPAHVAIALGLFFVIMVFLAQITGHWKSGLGENEFKILLKMTDSPMFGHPPM
jgi:polyferredoxin